MPVAVLTRMQPIYNDSSMLTMLRQHAPVRKQGVVDHQNHRVVGEHARHRAPTSIHVPAGCGQLPQIFKLLPTQACRLSRFQQTSLGCIAASAVTLSLPDWHVLVCCETQKILNMLQYDT